MVALGFQQVKGFEYKNSFYFVGKNGLLSYVY